MGASRQPEVVLKSDASTIVLELGKEGKFYAKASSWDTNRALLEGDHLDIKVRNGRWVLTHVPAEPPKEPPPVQHYFPSEE